MTAEPTPRAAGMDATRIGAAPRLFFLDWLRIAAFALLVPYHVGMLYVTWNFHVKSPLASPGLEPWMLLSSPWRMSLLFIVSGAATAFMLARGAKAPWLRQRTKRLLLPLLCGMLVVVPPQSYFEVVQKYGYAGSYVDFLGLYFSRYHGFCSSGKCLDLPTWNHLWFLPYLWAYTVLLWAVVRANPRALGQLGQGAEWVMRGAGLLALPVTAILLVRATLVPRFPSTHAFTGDWFNHAIYFGMFIAGAAFAHAPAIWERLMRARWPALLGALVAWAMLVNGIAQPGWLRDAAVATQQWGALVAAVGFARRHLNVDHRWRRRLTEAVFPVYVLHQTLIIVLSQALLPLHWLPRVEGPVLVAATFALSYAGYELVRRIRVLRPWFGLVPVTPAGTPLRTGTAASP